MKPTPIIQCPKCSTQNPQDSRYCNSCGQPLSSPSQMPTMGTPAAESPKPAETPHVARIISSDSIPAGGFTPGTILADRYRIIGLLGRGGMGEVYRADDLKLGQPVALKFLPPKLSEDPVRRERFFAEVRITRQLCTRISVGCTTSQRLTAGTSSRWNSSTARISRHCSSASGISQMKRLWTSRVNWREDLPPHMNGEFFIATQAG
jgi:serine/threonine protein kinase